MTAAPGSQQPDEVERLVVILRSVNDRCRPRCPSLREYAEAIAAAPSAPPAFHEWSVQGYIGPTGWAPDGWTGFHGPYLDAQAAWRVYDGQRRLWNKGRTGRPVRLVRRSIGSVEVVHGGR